jgi:hypothetical protein
MEVMLGTEPVTSAQDALCEGDDSLQTRSCSPYWWDLLLLLRVKCIAGVELIGHADHNVTSDWYPIIERAGTDRSASHERMGC